MKRGRYSPLGEDDQNADERVVAPHAPKNPTRVRKRVVTARAVRDGAHITKPVVQIEQDAQRGTKGVLSESAATVVGVAGTLGLVATHSASPIAARTPDREKEKQLLNEIAMRIKLIRAHANFLPNLFQKDWYLTYQEYSGGATLTTNINVMQRVRLVPP